MAKTRVLVAENHPSLRENLRYLVIDEILPGADGLAIAAIVANRLPGVRVVMYTSTPDVCELAREMGAAGCVPKGVPYEVLLGALRRAAPAPSLRAR